MSNIIFNEDMDIVYGDINDFSDEQDFAESVADTYYEITENRCFIEQVETKTCIITNKGIRPESITPIDETDIEIKKLYIADVEE